MRVAALTCVLLALTAGPSSAQQSDPYAGAVAKAARERLQARYDEFFEGVKIYSYAIACNAIPLKTLALGAIAHNRFYFVNKIEPYEDMVKKIDRILAEGPQVAKERGCDFWASNPDAILEVRQAALAGRMP